MRIITGTARGIVWVVAVLLLSACEAAQPSDPQPLPLPTAVAPSATPASTPTQNIEITAAESTPMPKASSVVFVVMTEQLLPPAKPVGDAEFEEVYSAFADAVQDRDLSALDGFLDEGTMSSFGGDMGKAAFYEQWGLDNNPKDSELWAEIEAILALGGVYDGEGRSFTAPYVFANFPLDGFEYHAIVGNNVAVYETESVQSREMDSISYNLLKNGALDAFWDQSDEDFVRIRTLTGAEGYVQKKFIRSPTDYRFELSRKEGGEWKLLYMLAGD
jgi:hypothetical protein